MQQITPIEIRQKSFDKSFRGYNPDEVDAFLHALAYAWERLITQLDEVKSALEANSKEVSRLQGIENALLRTVKDAEATAHNITKQAKKETELQARETKIETEKMIHEAREKVKAIEEENQRRHQHLKEQMEWALEKTKKRVQEAETYRDTLLQKLRHLAADILARSQLIEGNVQGHVEHNENAKRKENDSDMAPSPDSAALSSSTVVSAW